MKVFKTYIFLSLLVFVSCKKKEYPKSVIDPTATFYFNASINGAQVSIAAGENNYYMYSSYVQDSNNVYGFIGDLRQTNCGNCTNRLTIKINDSKVSAAGSSAQINQAIYPFSYPMVAGPSYSVKFQSSYNKTAAAYFWNFGDGDTSTMTNPMHTFARSGKYNVSLRIDGTNSCEGSVSNSLKFGYSGSCITSVSDSSAAGNTIQFFSNTQGSPALTYLWSFGDGSSSTLATPSHNYLITGGYPVSLRVTTATDTTYTEYNAITQGDQSSCATNYSISSVTQVSSLDLSGVTINWTDASGTLYTSDNLLQPSSSYFNVISVESYENNEKNETTKKVHVQFKCRVFNGTNYKTIDNADATICVSYK